ncbi:hypothetical protein TVAG_007610 [Trichomonas vaginalis G3]|uniref:Uncharacterized protein n=1 Tax=Trichomonas vaginalis (strain ATCC PRA-98 / G3) TaxID=412133 RepID=A2FSY8_TRIV3|nr:hypothetical protein TVAGG3_0349120 [Trichomonas vaginalis G3]EAX91984.1 hypothetical protein TVAG_007610 [Trichomonas vaginalis G3]KAI5531156.1 hypothetical protein TVAGG3_0349120 [Trichomonas vaginalis G3]|eukprot:XP_001304914.1 hypothetical protein [Trichomonas vaginalis G3]
MSMNINDITAKIDIIKQLMVETDLYNTNSIKPNKEKLDVIKKQIDDLDEKVTLVQETDGSIPEEILEQIRHIHDDFTLLAGTGSDESSDEQIERQEINIDIPEDAKSTGSSIIESKDSDTDTPEPKTTQRDFLQSLIIAILFCIVFALMWSYLV